MLTFSKIFPFSAVKGRHIITLNIGSVSAQFHFRASARHAGAPGNLNFCCPKFYPRTEITTICEIERIPLF
jgi:hypothetical protein